MKLHYLPPSPNSQGPLAVIKDLGLDVELENAYGKTRTEEYIKMNPCHCAPCVQIDDETAIWESGAVLRFLCNSAPNGDKLYPTDPLKRARVDMAMDWRQCNLYPCLPSIGYIIFGMECDDEAAKKDFVKILEHLKVLTDVFLKDTKFVYSDTPTIADLSIAPPLVFLKARPKFWAAVPDKVKEYFAAVLAEFPGAEEYFAMTEGMAAGCTGPSAELEP